MAENKNVHVMLRNIYVLREGSRKEAFGEYILQFYSCTSMNARVMILY